MNIFYRKKDMIFYPIFSCLSIFRYPTLIAFISINDDNYEENAFLDLVNGFFMKIAITQLLITLFEKFFHQNDPHIVLYLPKSNIKHPE